jgi:biopolymer transport protein ExbD
MKAYKKTLIHCQILLIFVVHTAVTLNETTTVNDQLPKTNNSSSSNNIKTDNNGGASERSDTKGLVIREKNFKLYLP